ncbi:hypothetical protein GCM10027589_13940 [Actinocorallia lasiicapitis]
MGRGDEEAGRLPSGRHSLTRDYVVQNQISRIIAGVIELAGTNGYAQLTVDGIIGRAGVSRATFYAHFKNKEDAFLQAFDSLAEEMIERVTTAIQNESGDDRGEIAADRRTRAGLSAFLDYLAGEPLGARMCIVESFAAGPPAAERRDAVIQVFTEVIGEHIRELFPRYPEPALLAEAVIGGIYQVAYTRIRRGEVEELPTLVNGLVAAFAIPDAERWGPENGTVS